MPTKNRSEIFRPGEQAVVHCMNRCVRKHFFLGYDRISQTDFGYRRQMFEGELRKATSGFAIDLLSFAIMDNHFHLILRSRPDVVERWSDTDVVLHWHKLCPIFKGEGGRPIKEPQPDSEEVVLAVANTSRVAKLRERLSDISWFMKLVSERMARWCNAEREEKGHFWEGRFKAVLLLDEQALLTCSMYVDLNRIKAELAKSLEESDYTSIQRRLQALAVRVSMRSMLAEQVNGPVEKSSIVTSVVLDENENPNAAIPMAHTESRSAENSQTGSIDAAAVHPEGTQTLTSEVLPDSLLSPVRIDEKNDPIGPHPSETGQRCSDKGFLPMTQEQYVDLLRWTADQLRHRHDGQKFDNPPPKLVELELEPEIWCKLVTQFTDMFFLVAGTPEHIDNHRSCQTGKGFHMPKQTRALLGA